ncbi:hypothetical protein [Burkholderia cenocepacia]|uniref:hypothetical protein n=1 Tax=Burkholderia cenocepacia TaxID=95486 RepID=UPI00268BA7D8
MAAHPDVPTRRLIAQIEPANGSDPITDGPGQNGNAQTPGAHLRLDIQHVNHIIRSRYGALADDLQRPHHATGNHFVDSHGPVSSQGEQTLNVTLFGA